MIFVRSNYAILCLLFCQNDSQIGLNDSLVIQCEFHSLKCVETHLPGVEQ